MIQKIICGYRIWCPTCGDKSARWIVEGVDATDAQKWVEDSFTRQYGQVAFPNHIDHGTITILEEWPTARKREQYNGQNRH